MVEDDLIVGQHLFICLPGGSGDGVAAFDGAQEAVFVLSGARFCKLTVDGGDPGADGALRDAKPRGDGWGAETFEVKVVGAVTEGVRERTRGSGSVGVVVSSEEGVGKGGRHGYAPFSARRCQAGGIR